jgi:hypothetical protein
VTNPGTRTALRAVFVSLLLLAPPGAARAAAGPMPPCGSAPPRPDFSAEAGHPDIATWAARDLPAGWQAPRCAAWAGAHFTNFVALSGQLPGDMPVYRFLAGFGAVSAWRGLPYWSVTDERLQPLIVDAYAVDGPSGDRRRADFTPAEMRAGHDLLFRQRDNRSGGAILYRLRVTALTPDRVVVEIENIDPVRKLFLTVFSPGDLHSSFILTRLASGRWGYYILSGAREGRIASVFSPLPSHINRTLALYAQTAGIAASESLPWSK